jgi:UvrD/REP helicase N-terminal domain
VILGDRIGRLFLVLSTQEVMTCSIQERGCATTLPPETERLLAGLTLEQAQAVRHGRGPLLLLAGPGAGKTKTLTHRVAHLLASQIARPPEILAVTFSIGAPVSCGCDSRRYSVRRSPAA